MQMITTIYELCIATERCISSVRPKKYYPRTLDRKYLYPVTLAITGCLMTCQHFITTGLAFDQHVFNKCIEGGNHTLFSVIEFSLDLFTISVRISTLHCSKKKDDKFMQVNSFAIKYCARRYEQMQGRDTLNARYQV